MKGLINRSFAIRVLNGWRRILEEAVEVGLMDKSKGRLEKVWLSVF